MLLNEYRLQPWTREAQEFLVEQMQEYFFGEGRRCPRNMFRPLTELAGGSASGPLRSCTLKRLILLSGRGSAW